MTDVLTGGPPIDASFGIKTNLTRPHLSTDDIASGSLFAWHFVDGTATRAVMAESTAVVTLGPGSLSTLAQAVTTSGGAVVMTGRFALARIAGDAAQSPRVEWALRRDGVALATTSFWVWPDSGFAGYGATCLDVPATGVHTYDLTVRVGSDATGHLLTAADRRLLITEFLR